MMLKEFAYKAKSSFSRDIIKTDTFKQTGITFTGTFINGILGAVFYILVARYLGPSNYGLLAVAIALLTLVADVGDLGTDTGLVQFVSRFINKDREKAHRFLKLGLEVKLIVSLFVIIVGFVFSKQIAVFVFAKPELGIPLKIASFGVASGLLFSFIIHTIQAMQKFVLWSLVSISSNLIRLVLLLFAFMVFGISLNFTLIVYIISPLIGFFIGMMFIDRGFLKQRGEMKVSKDFFHYNKWVASFTLVAAVSSRMDTFISARLLTASALGIYSAANQIVQIVPQLVGALGTVIAPKMAGRSSINDLVGYLKKTQIMTLVIAIGGLMSIPVVSLLVPVFYGQDYVGLIPIFIILLFAMLIFLISVPIHSSIFYYFSYPKLFFYLSIIHFMIITFVGWRLIGNFQAMGAAYTVLIGQIVNFLIPTIWVLRRIKVITKEKK